MSKKLNLSNKKIDINNQEKKPKMLKKYKQQFDNISNIYQYKYGCQKFLNNLKEDFYNQAANCVNNNKNKEIKSNNLKKDTKY